jgi:hypothetical protein
MPYVNSIMKKSVQSIAMAILTLLAFGCATGGSELPRHGFLIDRTSYSDFACPVPPRLLDSVHVELVDEGNDMYGRVIADAYTDANGDFELRYESLKPAERKNGGRPFLEGRTLRVSKPPFLSTHEIAERHVFTDSRSMAVEDAVQVYPRSGIAVDIVLEDTLTAPVEVRLELMRISTFRPEGDTLLTVNDTFQPTEPHVWLSSTELSHGTYRLRIIGENQTRITVGDIAACPGSTTQIQVIVPRLVSIDGSPVELYIKPMVILDPPKNGEILGSEQFLERNGR